MHGHARRMLRLGMLAAVSALATLLFTSGASAATINKYGPGDETRNFGTSVGGWDGDVDYDGLCIPAVTCPAVSNRYVAAGGADGGGDGYLQTRLGSLLGVGAVSTGTYRSPAFIYNGAGGKAPDKLKFKMSRRADVGALLAIAGNRAEYSVGFEKVRGGKTVGALEVIPPTSMAGANAWTSIDPVTVDPAVLDIGSQYRIVITSEFTTGAEVLAGGSSGYDRVLLRAMKRGADTLSPEQIDGIAGSALPGGVQVIRGANGKHRVRVQLKCQRKAPGKCRFKNLVLRSQRKAVTKKRRVNVASGSKKSVGLKPRNERAVRALVRGRRGLLTGRVAIAGKTRSISRNVKVRGG